MWKLFIFSSVLLTGCSLKTYQPPPPGQPVGLVEFQSRAMGFEAFDLYDSPTCASRGSTMAWFNGGKKTEPVKLAADKRAYIFSSHWRQTGISTGAGGSNYHSGTCAYFVSFVPLAGGTYAYRHVDFPGVSCRVEFIDTATGAQPADLQIHDPGQCTPPAK